MQYILTAKEYNGLVPKEALELKTKAAFEASKLLAETILRHNEYGYGWKGCVANKTAEYCDDCPAEKFCPFEWKNWSK